jgi:hypothetical protein
MTSSSEFSGLSIPAQYFQLSQAYADAAISSCRGLREGAQKASYASACVVIWLTRHATELFYKGALFAETGSVPSPAQISIAGKSRSVGWHNLVFYEHAFRQHFPEDKYPLSPPATEALLGSGWTDDQVAEFLIAADKTHERYRYPADKKGTPFRASTSFDPDEMLKILTQSRCQMNTIMVSLLKQEPERRSLSG